MTATEMPELCEVSYEEEYASLTYEALPADI